MRRKLKIAKRFAGLSIIEVVTASALLIVALVPILKGLTIAHASAAKIEHKTRSLILALAKLDEIKARSIYDYTNGGASFAENNTSLDGPYLCNVTDDSGDSLKTISVSAGYDANGNNDLGSDEVEITLTTLLARRWPD
jgi:Tfp pilus assembly protein PilV